MNIGTSTVPAREVPYRTSRHSVGLIHPKVRTWSNSTLAATGGDPAARLCHGQGEEAERRPYGYTDSLRDAEYDHDISLQLGGDANDARNLWVEPADPGHTAGTVNNKKDPVETQLHTAVCSGKVTLKAASRPSSPTGPPR
ncbi:hypothetical protein [Streptomyces puniciscabiei]|uniref:hypothetical protein n=1 Tax=Streptomyces puniciscabiei TaxID=164348 RepID=UPI003317FE4B